MPPFFFFLSGEHKTLPFAELRAILDAESITYKELQTLPQVLRLDTTADVIEALKRRAALTRTCCQELFCCKACYGDIVKAAQSMLPVNVIQPGESFAVRVKRVGASTRSLVSIDLERKLGQLVLDKYKGVKVNLKEPEKTFAGVITGDTFVFGLKLAELSPTPFMRRRPGNRPFFHPSAMPAKLARCMVNLAAPRRGDLLLDPFCGTGSFLIEAGLLGCRVLGSDADLRMVKGSLRNLKFFNVECEGLTVADAKRLPLTRVDCIVTDPPYGRSASTMGYKTKQIIQDFLTSSSDSMAKRQRICMASPMAVSIRETARPYGFTPVQSHLVYVHRSLTREVAVLEKV